MVIKAYSKLLFVTIAWGGMTVVMKFAVSFTSPFTLNFIRFLSAFLILLIFTISKGESLRVKKEDLLVVLSVALTGGIISSGFFLYGLSYSTASDAGLIVGTEPAITALIAAIIAKEAIGARTYLSSILSFIGIWFIVMQGNLVIEITQARAFGDLLIIVGAVAWSLFTVLNKFAVKKMNALVVTTYITLLAMIFYFPISIIERHFFSLVNLPLSFWLAVLYMAIFGTFISVQWWISSVGHIGAAKVGIFGSLVPVFSLIFSVTLLSEVITIFHLIGMALIVASVITVSIK